MKYHEELVVALRQELGLSGCPGILGVRLLMESLPWLFFHHDPDPHRARCAIWFDGTADVWAPEHDPYVICHEVAHALREVTLLACSTDALHLLKANWLHEEGACHAFARAFLLPPLETLSMNGELEEVSGCRAEVILTRRLELTRW